MPRAVRSSMMGIAAAFWLLSLCLAFAGIIRYSNLPGNPGAPPLQWPGESLIRRDKDKLTAVVFLHPRCPCSRATLAELETLLTETGDRLSVNLIFVRPPGTSGDWALAGLWRTAHEIPGATALLDRDGREAKHFAAETSGSVLLYTPRGQLLFSGGITAERGHSGPSAARDAFLAAIHTETAARLKPPVFGCSLWTPCATNSASNNTHD